MPISTVSTKLSISNSLSFTNIERLILPNRQEPPAGRGSSAQGFVPAYLNLGLFESKFQLSILSQNNIPGSAQFQLFSHNLSKSLSAIAVLVIVSLVSGRLNSIIHSLCSTAHCIKSFVIRVEMFALVTLSGLALMSINSGKSG